MTIENTKGFWNIYSEHGENAFEVKIANKIFLFQVGAAVVA